MRKTERKICVFFGQKDTPERVRMPLRRILTELIKKRGVNIFYVGNQGNFDSMVREELKTAIKQYPHIRYSVVLAYMPGKREALSDADPSDTIFAEGLEKVPPRFAIDRRNRMMVEWADIVVTYAPHTCGGAAKFRALAEKKGKEVFSLCE